MLTQAQRGGSGVWWALAAVVCVATLIGTAWGGQYVPTNADLHAFAVDRMPGVDASIGVPAMVERAVAERERAGTDEARIAMWSGTWGEWITIAHAAGKVGPEQWGRLLEHDHWVRLRVDGPAAVGERVPLHFETGTFGAARSSHSLQHTLHQVRVSSGRAEAGNFRLFNTPQPMAEFEVRGVALRLYEADGRTLLNEYDMGWGMSGGIGLVYGGSSQMGPFWPRDWIVEPGRYVVELVSRYRLSVGSDAYATGAPAGAFDGADPVVHSWQASDRVTVEIVPTAAGPVLDDFGVEPEEIAANLEIASVWAREGHRHVRFRVRVGDVAVPLAFRGRLVLDDGQREPIRLAPLTHVPGRNGGSHGDNKPRELLACLPADDCAGALASLVAGTWWIELVGDEDEAQWEPTIDVAWDGQVVLPGRPVKLHRAQPSGR